MITRTEAEYWKERSRLLEEYVQNLPPASAFNAEGRAAYKEWSTFVNNEGIPMPPSEPLFTETQVKAMVKRIGSANCLPEALYSWAVHVAKEAGVSFDPA